MNVSPTASDALLSAIDIVALQLLPLQTWGEELPVEYSNPLTIGFLAIFFLLMIGIGVFAGRFQTDSEDYFAGGRRAGLFVIGLSVFAGIQSGWGIVGNTGVIFLAGFEYFVLVALVPFLMVLSFWLLARKMRALGTRKDAITAPDAMYYRFEDDRLRRLGAAAVFLGSIGLLAPQYAALGIISAVVLPVGFFEALIISLVIVGFYTVVGGMLAALWSDAIQGAMMALGGLLTSYYVFTRSPGGFDGMVDTLSTELPGYFNMTLLGMDQFVFGVGFYISFLIVFATIAGQPHFIVKFYMSRNVSVLKYSAVIAAGGYLLTVLYWWTAPFMRAAVLRGEHGGELNPDAALPLALVEFAPPIVAAFVITAILAAIMSTRNTFMNIGAAAVVHD